MLAVFVAIGDDYNDGDGDDDRFSGPWLGLVGVASLSGSSCGSESGCCGD